MDPDTREEIPRISIENLQTWQRLQSGFSQAVLQQLDEEIKKQGSEEERDALQAHLLQFIDQTLATVQPNLRINGQPYDTIHSADTEPFDEALDRRIWSLAETRMQWFKRIAETRRSIPQDLAAVVLTTTEDHQALENLTIPDTADESLTAYENQLHESFEPHEEQIKEVVQRLSTLGDELSQTVPEQAERAKRTTIVTADVKSHKL